MHVHIYQLLISSNSVHADDENGTKTLEVLVQIYAKIAQQMSDAIIIFIPSEYLSQTKNVSISWIHGQKLWHWPLSDRNCHICHKVQYSITTS